MAGMLRWAVLLFVLAVIAAVFGYTGTAGAAARAFELAFFACIVLAIAMLAAALLNRSSRHPR
jgi:uncharacterized membrane protein YtjA (UPF0391 family)